MSKLAQSGFELATQWSEAQHATAGLRRPPLCNLRDSGHVWIIPFSEDIPYLFIAIVGSRTNRKYNASTGYPVTIPAWTKGQLLVGMWRRPNILRLDYDWCSHNSDFRIWSLRLRWSAYNMFSCPRGCLGTSVMDLCLADLHSWPWGLSLDFISWFFR